MAFVPADMKRTSLVLIGAVVVLIVAGVFWSRHRGTPAERTPAPPNAPVGNASRHPASKDTGPTIVRPAPVRWQMMKEFSTNAPMASPSEPGTEMWQPPPLTREQVEQYLARQNRSSASLLAAFTLAQDASFLLEAAERFPEDPGVQLAVLGMDAFPGERERWLEMFKQSAPDNALAGYLSALEAMRNADTEKALRELAEAGSKPALDFYRNDVSAELVNAYRVAGQSDGTAMMSAMSITPLPHLVELRELAKEMESLIAQARERGDAASADALAQNGLTLAGQLRGGGNASSLLEELVGMGIEMMFLKTLDPGATLGETRQTAAQRLAALQSQRQKISDLVHAADPEGTLPTLSDAERVRYFNLVASQGEYNALLWLRDLQRSRR
jgi:hypothetical protein